MTTLFTGGDVFDGTGSGLQRADVLIDGGTIIDVGSGLSGDTVIDCSGMTLLPGLFDSHVHMLFPDASLLNLDVALTTPIEELLLQFPQTAKSYLEMGITTVRDAAGAGRGLRSSVAKGYVSGPRMQVSIAMLSPTGGHADGYLSYGANPFDSISFPGDPDPLCDGVDGCIVKTREVIRAGADVIKIAASGGFLSPNDDPQHPNFLQEEIDAIVRAAADLGRPVMAHAHGAEAIKRSVRAGVRSIEHGTFLDEEGAELMAESGTWLVATLTTSDTTEALANDEQVPETVRAKLRDMGNPEFNAFQLAVDHGVKIAMGTDCPVAPHGTNLRELELMAEHGLTAEQSLVAATSGSAELMGLESVLGTIETGKIADVVVVEGDPFIFADLANRIDQVWKDGIQVV